MTKFEQVSKQFAGRKSEATFKSHLEVRMVERAVKIADMTGWHYELRMVEELVRVAD